MQDIENDQQIQLTSTWLNAPLDLVEIQYDREYDKDDRASLSWHLTSKEKKSIINSIRLPENQQAIRKLQELL